MRGREGRGREGRGREGRGRERRGGRWVCVVECMLQYLSRENVFWYGHLLPKCHVSWLLAAPCCCREEEGREGEGGGGDRERHYNGEGDEVSFGCTRAVHLWLVAISNRGQNLQQDDTNERSTPMQLVIPCHT